MGILRLLVLAAAAGAARAACKYRTGGQGSGCRKSDTNGRLYNFMGHRSGNYEDKTHGTSGLCYTRSYADKNDCTTGHPSWDQHGWLDKTPILGPASNNWLYKCGLCNVGEVRECDRRAVSSTRCLPMRASSAPRCSFIRRRYPRSLESVGARSMIWLT